MGAVCVFVCVAHTQADDRMFLSLFVRLLARSLARAIVALMLYVLARCDIYVYACSCVDSAQ